MFKAGHWRCMQHVYCWLGRTEREISSTGWCALRSTQMVYLWWLAITENQRTGVMCRPTDGPWLSDRNRFRRDHTRVVRASRRPGLGHLVDRSTVGLGPGGPFRAWHCRALGKYRAAVCGRWDDRVTVLGLAHLWYCEVTPVEIRTINKLGVNESVPYMVTGPFFYFCTRLNPINHVNLQTQPNPNPAHNGLCEQWPNLGCLRGCIGWELDSWSKGRWFDSRPGRYQVN